MNPTLGTLIFWLILSFFTVGSTQTAAPPQTPPPSAAISEPFTQPLPKNASSIRLQLPAPIDRILLRRIGPFGSHQGGHLEGLDHEWIEIKNDAPIAGWANGEVKVVKKQNSSDPKSVWRITVFYGDGLYGEYMAIQTPLVEVGDFVQAKDPIGWGETAEYIPKGYQNAEFNLTDAHRSDGIKTYTAPSGVFVSPFDYLREDVKQELMAAYEKEILEPFLAKGNRIDTFTPWEPYFTNPLVLHPLHHGTLVGEWYLMNKKWANDGIPDLLTFLPPSKYYAKHRVLASEDSGLNMFEGDWEVDATLKRIKLATDIGLYYGIYELDESGPRASLKIEWQLKEYPSKFSDKANVYVERENTGRRQNGVDLGVRSSLE